MMIFRFFPESFSSESSNEYALRLTTMNQWILAHSKLQFSFLMTKQRDFRTMVLITNPLGRIFLSRYLKHGANSSGGSTRRVHLIQGRFQEILQEMNGEIR